MTPEISLTFESDQWVVAHEPSGFYGTGPTELAALVDLVDSLIDLHEELADRQDDLDEHMARQFAYLEEALGKPSAEQA